MREKARQGLLTGMLPWGYLKGTDRIAQPDPEKASYVRRLFEMYATGQHTDRTLTAWLNLNEQRTARGRAFGVDIVREMLCNAAYAGYVSGHRDTSKAIKGLHEPIVEETLFDRVQQMRRERARTLKPGRPSPNYLLRGLARCRCCDGRMQGTTGGRQNKPRYYCATAAPTAPAISPAEQVEHQASASSSASSSAASARPRPHRRRPTPALVPPLLRGPGITGQGIRGGK